MGCHSSDLRETDDGDNKKVDKRIALRIRDAIPALAKLKKVTASLNKSTIVRVLSEDNLQS